MMFMLVQVLIINLQMHLFYILFTRKRLAFASLFYVYLFFIEITLAFRYLYIGYPKA